ncbi:retrotransposon protein, putative, ty1-copia subclass [Tanacetum coccineum]
MHVFGTAFTPAPRLVLTYHVAQWTTLYDAHTEIACLMLGVWTPDNFIDILKNYNMHNMGKTIGEIHAMLIEYEKGLPKKAEIPQVMMIKSGKIQKANKKSLNAKGKNKVKGKGKNKKDYIPMPKNHKPTAMERPAKDDACLHCKEVGHWKRNFSVYLAELQKKIKQVGSASSSGIFTIELFFFPNNNSWVYDTGCGTNMCITKQGFRIERKLKQGALYLYAGNGVRAQVEAIRSFDLVLPNGLVICLDNCHYAPTITRGVVYVSRLVDNGFVQCFTDYGISVSKNGLTPPYTPQHNGVFERRNRTLLDMVRSMMNLTTLPLSFWDYALESATRILIMCSTKKGSGDVRSCARMLDFFEKASHTSSISGRVVDLEEIQEEEEDTTPSEITSNIPQEVEGFEPPQEEVIPIRRSERTHRAPNRLCLNVEVEEHSLGDLNEPTSYKAAMLDLESNKWIDAMNAKIQSMMDNMVWVLVDLPPGCKTVGSRWLFKKKTDMDGIVHVYKARLVAKGYTQLYGVDYEETFSPVADIRAIRILISIAAYYDYEIWQMDVKTAFLNGYLDEDIYMVQPEGFVDPNHPRKVCKLQRSIYGLKQASRSWNKRFDEEIKRFGFTQNLDEPCVYQKASGRNVTFLILYVDDIIIMGNHIPSLQSVKDYLGKCFAMKDLGEAAFILGIKIYRDRSKRLIGLCQNAYMDKILKRYKMDNSKRGHIPMQERLDLNKSQGAQTPKEVNRIKNVPYASAVISVMYAVRCTRPDVAFAKNMTSRFQQNPGEPNWTAIKNILMYLRNTKNMFLVYGGNNSTELRVKCYCDAGFETDRDDTKSQTGYVFILNRGAVDWKSSKQSTTAMSATESEYIAASEAAMEVVWIRKFISGLGIVPTINEHLNMYCNNSAAVHYANEPGVQKGARHYHRRYHYVCEYVELGEIKILKVHTDNNLADPFIKALSNRKLTQHARGMGLHPASSFM